MSDNNTAELNGGASRPAKSLVQEDRTTETYRQLRTEKKAEDIKRTRPFWKRDWRK